MPKRRSVEDADKYYLGRHNDALKQTQIASRPNVSPFEIGFIAMFKGWQAYADAHLKRYEQHIGDDPYTGEHWKNIGESLRALLTCEIGRLLGADMDREINHTMQKHHIEPED